MIFSVLYEPDLASNLTYLISRILGRMRDSIFLYLTIAILITIALTWFYHSYAMTILKRQARNLIQTIKFTLSRQDTIMQTAESMQKQVYSQRRQQKKEKRKKFVSEFEK